MIKRICFFNVLLLLLLFVRCTNEREIKVSSEDIEYTTFRFNQFIQNHQIDDQLVVELQNELPAFMEAFVQAILLPDQTVANSLTQFVTYFDSTKVNLKINQQFGSLSRYEKEFETLQKRLITIAPNFKPIDLITMNSGFNFKNFLVDDAIAVGLDMYLGNKVDYELFGSQFPKYKVHTFDQSYLVPDIAHQLLVDLYPERAEQSTLLSKLIYNGKLAYVKSLLLPDTDVAIFLNMTEESLEWCAANERNIWRYFITEELLYSNDFSRFKTYVSEGPFSSGMPQGAPANTASYVGYKIVKQYMQTHPKVSLFQLLENNDVQLILNRANYKP